MTIKEKILDLNKRFFPQIKRILFKHAHVFMHFREADLKEDTEEGFDSVLSFPDIKIPIRIRKNDFLKYKDFTIRSISRYNQPTEIDKLRLGFGDYYFYAWENKTGNGIEAYMIIDLDIFRSCHLEKPDSKDIRNGDGTCFNTYDCFPMIKTGAVKIIENL